MTEQNQTSAVALNWRTLLVSVVVVVAATGLALLLIPSLSMNAAIRGGSITIGAVLVGRLIMWWQLRSKRSKH